MLSDITFRPEQFNTPSEWLNNLFISYIWTYGMQLQKTKLIHCSTFNT